MTAIDFAPSANFRSIYYADMFCINGRGALFMGHGKSDCARRASDNLESNEVGQDFICLSRKGDELFGHYQPFLAPSTYVGSPVKIDVLIRCLSNEETQEIFGTDALDILTTDFNGFLQSCRFNITFTGEEVYPMMNRHLTTDEYEDFIDPDRRGWRFVDLVQSAIGLEILIVPWMPSSSERVELLRKYV